MARLVFLIILFAVAYLMYHMYGKKLIQQGPKSLIKPLIILAGLLLIFAVATGRASAIFALIGGILAGAWRMSPLILRFWPQIRQFFFKFTQQQAGTQGTSRVTSASLIMTLDHDTGRIDGKITSGQFRERALSSLSLEELKQFYATCQKQDVEALRLLDAFIQREYPDQWQTDSAEGSGTTTAEMREDDAWDILGLDSAASREEIVAAHRRLMSTLHPDKGGSNYLASRVNQAKDLLLKKSS